MTGATGPAGATGAMIGTTTAATGAAATTAVERYLACMAAHDWDGLAATIADEDLVRDGPFCDVVEGKAAYVEFLRASST